MALNKVEICGLDTSKLPKITQSESRELLSRKRTITTRMASHPTM